MIDVKVDMKGIALDPTKSYILEIRRGDLPYSTVEQSRRAFREAGINTIIVVSETGNAINVVEIPQGKTLDEVAEELA